MSNSNHTKKNRLSYDRQRKLHIKKNGGNKNKCTKIEIGDKRKIKYINIKHIDVLIIIYSKDQRTDRYAKI